MLQKVAFLEKQIVPFVIHGQNVVQKLLFDFEGCLGHKICLGELFSKWPMRRRATWQSDPINQLGMIDALGKTPIDIQQSSCGNRKVMAKATGKVRMGDLSEPKEKAEEWQMKLKYVKFLSKPISLRLSSSSTTAATHSAIGRPNLLMLSRFMCVD